MNRTKRLAAAGTLALASLGLVGASVATGQVASAAQSSAVVSDASIAAAPGKAGGKVCKRKYYDQYGRSYCIKWA